jgi:hypothetical protein
VDVRGLEVLPEQALSRNDQGVAVVGGQLDIQDLDDQRVPRGRVVDLDRADDSVRAVRIDPGDYILDRGVFRQR